jgi:hypothetical protein
VRDCLCASRRSPQKRYALSKPPISSSSSVGGGGSFVVTTLAPPSVPHPRTARPGPIFSCFQDLTNRRTASRARTPRLSGVVKQLVPPTVEDEVMATMTPPDTPAPWCGVSFVMVGTANGSTNPSDEEDSFDAKDALDSAEEYDPENKEAMKAWFAMFRILDRLKSHVGQAGAVTVKLRISAVHHELDAILEGGDLSLTTLRRCRDWLARIEDEFVHAQPAVASPHPKHPLSIQNKEIKLLQSLDEILSILRSLADPIVRSRASPPNHSNATRRGRHTV